MQTTMLFIVCVAVIGCSVVIVVAISRAGRAVGDAVQEQLGGAERRFLDALERLRGGTEAALRDGQQVFAKGQADLTVALQAALHSSRTATASEIETRSASLQQHLSISLTEARREQADKLERLDATLADAVTTLSKSTEETKTVMAEGARDQAKMQIEASEKLSSTLSQCLAQLNDTLVAGQQQAVKELAEARELQTNALAAVQSDMHRELTAVRDVQAQAARDLRDRLQSNLETVRKDTEEKLERIRETVDERLQSTLENRLGESFKLVSDRLEQVHRGLGEMQALACGVGDLKRMLTNVRSRGVFGEVQLRRLLEEVLTPEQYAENVTTVPSGSERVEFAIKLPGREGDDCVYVPIDSKFPQEDYQRLQEAFEKADADAVEEGRRALRRRALLEAEAIHRKYVAPPFTTEFALMFLATEGLYAEILRIPGLHDEMLRVHRVVAVGPTTLQALLTSLQMGFRTLAIEQRSAEVWKVLAAIKTEFGKFGCSLDAVSKKIHEAGNKIDDVSRRSRAMERKLKNVEQLPDAEATQILEIVTDEEDVTAPAEPRSPA